LKKQYCIITIYFVIYCAFEAFIQSLDPHAIFAMAEESGSKIDCGVWEGWFSVKFWKVIVATKVGRSFTHDEDSSLICNGVYRMWGMWVEALGLITCLFFGFGKVLLYYWFS
jgi:hypothetical protein